MCGLIRLNCPCLVCTVFFGLFCGIIMGLKWRWGATARQMAGLVSTVYSLLERSGGICQLRFRRSLRTENSSRRLRPACQVAGCGCGKGVAQAWSKLWSRMRECMTGVFTKSHWWIWVTPQGRMYLWLIYLYSGCSGQYQSCLGCSHSWNNFVTPAKSNIAALKLTAARSVGRKSNWT